MMDNRFKRYLSFLYMGIVTLDLVEEHLMATDLGKLASEVLPPTLVLKDTPRQSFIQLLGEMPTSIRLMKNITQKLWF